jgi:Domain of unknown function (DUF1735)
MKKKLIIIATILSGTALFMSSCLKDKSHYVDFSQGGTFVDFGSGGFVNFSTEAITETPADSVNGQPNTNEAITRQFAVNVASVNLPTSPTTVTLAVGDQSFVDKLNTLQSNVIYTLMPANAYTLAATKVTIPAGQQYANTSVTFLKALLDPSKSYVLPIYIADGGGQKISANLNILYYHFIGNDFAGVVNSDFHRFNNGDTTANFVPGQSYTKQPTTIFPVSPTQFEVYSGYAGGIYRYEVTFTKTGVGASALYSNFSVVINGDDVAAYSPAPNFINLVTPAKIQGINPDATPPAPYGSAITPTGKTYTLAQAFTLLNFSFGVTSGAANAPRALTDRYYK